MKRYKSINEVWNDLTSNPKIPIYWENDSYKVMIETLNLESDYQLNHHTRKGDKILSVRCISNHFGSLLEPEDISKLYLMDDVKEGEK